VAPVGRGSTGNRARWAGKDDCPASMTPNDKLHANGRFWWPPPRAKEAGQALGVALEKFAAAAAPMAASRPRTWRRAGAAASPLERAPGIGRQQFSYAPAQPVALAGHGASAAGAASERGAHLWARAFARSPGRDRAFNTLQRSVIRNKHGRPA